MACRGLQVVKLRRRIRFASDPIQPPAIGQALELVFARALEEEARARYEVLDGLRREYFGWTGSRSNP
jgi:hypothetical protein